MSPLLLLSVTPITLNVAPGIEYNLSSAGGEGILLYLKNFRRTTPADPICANFVRMLLLIRFLIIIVALRPWEESNTHCTKPPKSGS